MGPDVLRPFRWDRTFYPQGPDGICYHVRSSNRGPDAIHKTSGPSLLLFLHILGWSAAAGLAKATSLRRRQSKTYRLRGTCARRRLAEDGRPKKVKGKTKKRASKPLKEEGGGGRKNLDLWRVCNFTFAAGGLKLLLQPEGPAARVEIHSEP